MEHNLDIADIYELLGRRQLREAIDRLESVGYKYPELRIGQSVEQIRANYDLMAGYWQRGYKDASLDAVYDGLIHDVYRLTADADLSYAVTHSSYLSGLYRRSRMKGRDDTFLATATDELEGFVSELAILELEPEHTRQERTTALYAKRQAYMADVFDYIVTSSQWSEGTVESMRQTLLSPTVDGIDQQTIVSAVTLSVMNVFDINKLRLLVDVYRGSGDEYVRQRALVGIVFGVWNSQPQIFPSVKDMIGALLSDENTLNELTELQIQLLYCINAERDTKTIQEEIMPDLIKHNNIHITSKGIEEREDDPMEDILDSEASERRMEKIEESFRKMIDMQKAGADIYFGGFAQMKRFPFFDNVSNWFTPYYAEHPAISALYRNKSDMNMVNNMISRVAFCNSDRYSFVIAFHRVVDKLPANLREMLSNNSLTLMGESVTEVSGASPAVIRRLYLQDFYRFFRLFHSRECYNSPFQVYAEGNMVPGYVFFADPVYRGTRLEGKFGEIVACMVKRKLFADAFDVLSNYSDESKDYQYYMLCGNLLLHHRSVGSAHGFSTVDASACFGYVVKARPDDAKALFGYARAVFYAGNYAEAAAAYEKLVDAHPDNKNYILGYCVCKANLGQYEETQQHLFKLNYEHPDDYTVKRVLARTLVGTNKYEQAMKLYETLGTEAEDVANRAYCEWFMGDVKQAAAHFADYIVMRYPNTDTETKRKHCQADVIDSERDFILAHGISQTETFLMVDAIRDAIVR